MEKIIIIIAFILIAIGVVDMTIEEKDRRKNGNQWSQLIWQASNENEALCVAMIILGLIMMVIAVFGES